MHISFGMAFSRYRSSNVSSNSSFRRPLWPRIGGHHAAVVAQAAARQKTRKKKSNVADGSLSSTTTILSVASDGSDAWKLEDAADMIRQGMVGITPTDTYPALICDISNKEAVKKLYELKGASPKKTMSILVRNMTDISEYTEGFPVSHVPGQTSFFKVAKKILPGPFTLILGASKSLPKQIIDFEAGKSKKRKTVGVRLVDHVVCQELLNRLDRPVLCSSAILPDDRMDTGHASSIPDVGTMCDYYGSLLGFIIDVEDDAWDGVDHGEPSTILDLSDGHVTIVRRGRGDVSWLEDGSTAS